MESGKVAKRKVTVAMFRKHVSNVREELYFLNIDDVFFEGGDWPGQFNRWRDTDFDNYLRHLQEDNMSLQTEVVHYLFMRKLIRLRHEYSLELAMFAREQVTSEQREDLLRKLVQP